jgi:hypothetical protein
MVIYVSKILLLIFLMHFYSDEKAPNQIKDTHR